MDCQTIYWFILSVNYEFELRFKSVSFKIENAENSIPDTHLNFLMWY